MVDVTPDVREEAVNEFLIAFHKQAGAGAIENVVGWLRGLHWTHTHKSAADFFAAAIEAGAWRNG